MCMYFFIDPVRVLLCIPIHPVRITNKVYLYVCTIYRPTRPRKLPYSCSYQRACKLVYFPLPGPS